MNLRLLESVVELLGFPATDKVTGFTGVITSTSFDLYGCVQVIITPAAVSGKERLPGHWYDVNQIEVHRDQKRVINLPQFNTDLVTTPGPAEKPLQ